MKKIITLLFTLVIGFGLKAQCPLTQAVDFTATDIHGTEVHLFDILNSGQYVLIEFFFTTAGPCQQATPKVAQSYYAMGCNMHDVFYMEISDRDSDAACQNWVTNFGVEYLTISGVAGGSGICNTYQVGAFPTVILIAPNRQIVIQDLWPINNAQSIITALEAQGLQQHDCNGTTYHPLVGISVAQVMETEVTATFTPNEDCVSYAYMLATENEMQEWTSSTGIGLPEYLWNYGIHNSGVFTHWFSNLTPNTEYVIFAVSVDINGSLGEVVQEAVTTLPSSSTHGYVDLGLPSGLLWAICNVGANATEEYGDYFAWGETQPKDDYSWNTYQYSNGIYGNALTKYCTNSSYGYNGFTDNLTILLPEDDAATANWGNDWRMPTKEEWQELCNNTTVIWTIQNGVRGRLFTAANGNSLFLPAAGFRTDDLHYNAGSFGDYWSSSLNTDVPDGAWGLDFGSGNEYNLSGYSRACGFTVRPVRAGVQNYAPTGAINGLFSVGEGQQVYFSQGNLQYQASTNTWKFADNQWDYVGEGNNNISPTYDGWIDLFGWGTSGYDHGAVCYQPWSSSSDDTDYYAYGQEYYNLNDQSGRADWGYNAISNGGNAANQWRTLTQPEWNYVLFTRTTSSGIRYVKANVNGVNGVILLPDDWNPYIYSLNNINNGGASYGSNIITASEWNVMEQAGAIFLPAAGIRLGTSVDGVDDGGSYWSATYFDSDCPYYLGFYVTGLYTGPDDRYFGFSVRLVSSAQVTTSYSINATPNPMEGGTVTGVGTYYEGTTCTLTAIANEGYSFINWTKNGMVVSTNASYSFTVTETASYVANFMQNQGSGYVITATANPPEGGRVILGTSESLLFEPFEEYTLGNKIAAESIAAGHDWWTTWSNAPGSAEDAVVANYNGTQCAHLTYGNDQVLLLGDEENGIYDLEFDILVPQGKNGYFNILHHFAGSNSTWAMQCYLHMTNDGQNSTQAPGHGTIHAGSNNTADIPCVYDAWMHFRLNVDTDTDVARYYYTAPGENEILICEWQWSLDSFGENLAGRTLSAMNFFPPENAATSEFYLDNFRFNKISGDTAAELTINPMSIQRTLGEDDIINVPITISNYGNSIGDWSGWLDFGQGGAGSQTVDLYYHNGDVDNATGIGSSDAYTREFGIRLPANAYASVAMGMKITSAKFFVNQYTATDYNYIFRIYGQGLDNQPGELLAEKTVYSTAVGSWITATFDYPVYMTGQTIWATVQLEQAADEYPLSMDGGDYGEEQDGNWLSTNGNFFNHCYSSGAFGGAWLISVNCQGELVPATWASINKTEGSIFGGQSETVTLSLNSIGLNSGSSYTANLILNTNDESMPYVEIPVTLNVSNNKAANDVDSFEPLPTVSDNTMGKQGSVRISGVYEAGSICNMTAIPYEGYTFTNWTKNGVQVSTNAAYSFIVTENASYVANFRASNVNHWDVDIHQYPYNMSVTGIIQIDGVEQQTETLEIGAFCGSECRGTQRLTYFPQVNRYLVFLTLYGDAGDVMSFRLYDHALGQELDMSCSSTIAFVPDGFMGTPFDPYVFDFNMTVDQITNFSQGYNWWCSYIEQSDIDGLGMLQEGLGNNGVSIRSQANGYTDYYQGYGWYGSLSSINNESSYRVITSAPCTVTMTGNMAVPSEHPISLGQGWTWIGYVPTTAMDVNVAMSGLTSTSGDKLKSQQGYADYYPGYGWFGSLNTIEPGMGLMYYSMNGNPVTFTYPDNGRGGEQKQNLTSENNHWKPNTFAYPDNMTVMAVVELNDEELSNENYELAAFAANGECRGSVKLTYAEPLNRLVAFLTISGKDAAELSFRLYDTETGVEYYDAEESLSFVANAIVGDASDLYVVHFRGTTGMDELASSVKVYPNPVNRGEQFSIGLSGDVTDLVSVEIVNTLGVVKTVHVTSRQTFTVPNVAGVYTLRITVEGKGTVVKKLIVK